MATASVSIPLDFDPQALLTNIYTEQAKEYFATLPPPDPWLTIPEAAAYVKCTEGHMRLLVHGRPYRAATAGKPERPAVLPKIASGDLGHVKGSRIRRSVLDAYMNRHAYKKRAS
jgi:hypothetical protein